MVWWILQNHHLHLISCRLEVPLPSFSAKLPTHLVLPFNDHHINDDDHHIDNHHHYYHCIPPLPPCQVASPPPVAAPSQDNADVKKNICMDPTFFSSSMCENIPSGEVLSSTVKQGTLFLVDPCSWIPGILFMKTVITHSLRIYS